ncbi:unnamed protein product [Somion occarium]|uniref:Uncharacterized protein n=1 Tax=Somion occarium TaxID=3059160 RepID=A0ABP1D6S2_9APHY
MTYPTSNAANTVGTGTTAGTDSTVNPAGTTAGQGPISRGIQHVENAAGVGPASTTGTGTGVGTGAGAGLGAGAGTGTGIGAGLGTGAHAPTGATTRTAGPTSGGVSTGKVPIGQKLAGEAEKLAGKVTRDPGLVIQGEERKHGANVGGNAYGGTTGATGTGTNY